MIDIKMYNGGVDRLGNALNVGDDVLFAIGSRLIEGKVVEFGKVKTRLSYRVCSETRRKWTYPHSIITPIKT